jgi:hypothetical protein
MHAIALGTSSPEPQMRWHSRTAKPPLSPCVWLGTEQTVFLTIVVLVNHAPPQTTVQKRAIFIANKGMARVGMLDVCLPFTLELKRPNRSVL